MVLAIDLTDFDVDKRSAPLGLWGAPEPFGPMQRRSLVDFRVRLIYKFYGLSFSSLLVRVRKINPSQPIRSR